MHKQHISDTSLASSRLVYGCMRSTGTNSATDRARGKQAFTAAFEAGFTHFDHADIYGGGECEALFGEWLRENPGLREKLLITSKAGIRANSNDFPKRYDFSQQYIIDSVNGSLSRLGIEQLDLFLLHRPDYLMNAQEVADTFELLHQQGKVKHFGVSNFSTSQVELLQSKLSQPLVCNQIEINLHNIDSFHNGTLDQCQRLGMTPIAWCPLGAVAYPAWGNTFSAEDEQRIADELQYQSQKYGQEPWVIALAWLLAHPSKILPIIGSTQASRIQQSVEALSIEYQRADWYRLLEARNGVAVP